MKYKRVHIFEGAGSGKTTLAKAYSNKFGTSHYELDDFVWLHASTRHRRDEAERDQLLHQTINSEEWVLDGIFWQLWVHPSLARADKIIVLAIPEITRQIRVVKRHLQLLRQARLRDYPTFFPTLYEFLKLNREYNKGPLQDTRALVSDFLNKVSVCTSNAEAAQKLGL